MRRFQGVSSETQLRTRKANVADIYERYRDIGNLGNVAVVGVTEAIESEKKHAMLEVLKA